MEFGIPFDVDPTSPVPDEYEVTAAEERMRIGAKVTDGVYPQVRIIKDNILEPQTYIGESLRVSAGVGLSVNVSPGIACVGSTDYFNTETKVISFEKNNVKQIYDIVVELDLVNQKTLAKKQIRLSGMKVTDSMVRTKHIHQICLATVTIPENAEEIVTANIEEQRLNTALATDGKPVCGLVGSVMQADTRIISEALNQQILENDVKMNSTLERYNGQIVKNQQDYEEWFTNVKIELGKDAAINLLNLINDVKSTTYTKTATDLTRTYTLTHSKSGAVHTLAGLPTTNGIYQCQFVATADYAEGDTFADDYTAKPQGEETKLPDKAFISGDIVSVTADVGGKKLGFKLGGGGCYGTLSPQIRNFAAKAGNNEITLSWQNPSDSNFAGLYIVRKQGSQPTKLSDGTKIDVAKATTYTDNEPENDKLYYYRAFPYNAKKQVQTELTGAVVSATPKATMPLKDLPVGTLVVDPNTKYYNQPIVWRIADQNHWAKDSGYPVNATTLISDKILTCKCFDAKEPNNSNNDRRQYGNNYYYDSNLRQWLNRDSPAGQWYTSRHSQDASPAKERTPHNEYDMQAGFLNDFSNNFRNILLQTLLRTVKNTITDGGGSEDFYNKIITASCTEVGLANENGIAEGAKLDLFNNDFSRKAIYTEESARKDANGIKLWWLRTPQSEYSDYARIVDGDGKINYSTAYTGVGGVRPLCNLPNNIYVNSTPNSDGSYNIVF